MSAADIPPSISKILRKKSSASRFVDNGTAKTSITKRAKIPSSKALVPVPTMPEKRFAYTGKVYKHEDNLADVGESNYEWGKWAQAHPDDLDELVDVPTSVGFRGRTKTQKMRIEGQRSEFYGDVVDYEGNPKGKVGNARSNKANKAKSRINIGNNLKDFNKPVKNEPRDTDYVEIPPSLFRKAPSKDARNLRLAKKSKSVEPTGIAAISENKRWIKSKLVKPSKIQDATGESSKFRKAPSKDARNLGIAKKSKSTEPAGIAAISKQKRRIKSELFKPSEKARKDIDDKWLIDRAFDQLVDTGKAVGKVAGKAGKVAGIAAKTGLNATKAGLREFNEISEIVVQNPMLIRMGQAHEATLRGMASQRRHALGSIAATGKKSMSVGSLVEQKGFVTRTNTQAVAPYPTQNQVIPKVIHRKGGDQVRYFLPTGQEVSAAVARKLLHGSVSVPTQANIASTTVEHTYSRDNTTQIVQKSAKTVSGLVRRNKRDGSVNKTCIATPAGLFHRHNSGVV